MAEARTFKIVKPYYPIVYVRGYAMTASERADVFHDAYYGFAATSVERREAPPPRYYEVDIFEGQFVRLMKMGDYSYADAVNRGLETFHDNPSRSIWVSRFYDEDHMREQIRSIETHAEELRRMICETIPDRLERCGVDLGPARRDYKVILVAHSMGGLVCRTVIQKLFPEADEDPKRWIHRLVTIGTPNRGIDLGVLPDFIEAGIAKALNPFDSNIFSEHRMREYLRLDPAYDIHSIGDGFPIKRCLCIVGSDHQSYGAVRHATGAFSDGLVKQDRAYIVAGKRPQTADYPDAQRSFWANVHRAHSGRRGIVNSYETFENIHRFLFGDTMAEIYLENMRFPSGDNGVQRFFDVEFLMSIRGTGVYLHRREQDPCENAIRLTAAALPDRVRLHVCFLNSSLRPARSEPFSHFALTVKVIERRVRDGFLWDHEYPARPIYDETVELRIGDFEPEKDGAEVQYRWLSEGADWATCDRADGKIVLPLREASAFSADLAIHARPWPAPELTQD